MPKKIKKEYKKNAPVGVKIISVLNYINSALSVIVGVLFILLILINYDTVISELEDNLGVWVTILLSLFLIAVGVIAFLIARGLWNGKEWARITQIILSAAFAVIAIINLIGGEWSSVLSLAVNGLIAGYLSLNKKVKEFFK